jgi:hypothetical protein
MRLSFPLALCLWGSSLWSGALAQSTPDPFVLGVQTHFEQGWKTKWSDKIVESGAHAFRDELSWGKIEAAQGKYDFSVPDLYMNPSIAAGLSPLIVVTDSNKLYDDGNTPSSLIAQDALAAYLAAAVDHYAPQLTLLEIGNEVNASEFGTGPFSEDKPKNFASMVRQIHQRIKPASPEVKIICSGVNSISIGFLRDFFKQGGLSDCDGISIHPYRKFPETLDLEIDRLNALMAEFGGIKPIYVTEFGNWFEDPNDAPDYMLKMVAMMGASGVAEAYWYALLDEPYWPNMGLYEASGAEKPALKTFEFLQQRLLPLGRPVSRGTARTARVIEFGTGGNGFVAWGVSGDIEVTGKASYFNSLGEPIPPKLKLDENPVVILGSGIDIKVVQQVEVADSLYQYGTPPWSYFARRPDGQHAPLQIIDWQWTSYIGAPDLSPLAIRDESVTTAKFADEPYDAVERFTAAKDGVYRIEAWWQALPKSEASEIRVWHNDTAIAQGTAGTSRYVLPPLTVTLQSGDTLDFEVGPGGPNGDGSVSRRIQIQGPLSDP